jgi:hypothetical protein
MRQTPITVLALLALLSCGQQAGAQTAGAEKTHAGLFLVSVSGTWGYIDKTGKLVINPQFAGASSFSEGLALVWVGAKAGYIDKAGKFVWEESD